jgi:N-acetylglucosamine repressor
VARLTVDDVVARARAREPRALEALRATARYLGLGLASIVNSIDPGRIYVGGEITRAWDLLETTVRAALRERVLFPAAGDVSLAVVPAEEYPRLRGAAALVAAPAFAAPVVA